MIKLYGMPLSNYYNTIKLCLLEKGVAFEEVLNPPSQDGDYLTKSPMGKVPCIETDSGFLAESSAIMEYLEEAYPAQSLFPGDAYTRAKIRELNKVLELYIELPARRHLAATFFGEPRNQAAVAEVRPQIEQGLGAIERLAAFNPYFAGDEISYADLFGFYVFGMANMLTQAVYGWDIVGEVPKLGATLERIGARETTQNVNSAMQSAMDAFMEQQQQAS